MVFWGFESSIFRQNPNPTVDGRREPREKAVLIVALAIDSREQYRRHGTVSLNGKAAVC